MQPKKDEIVPLETIGMDLEDFLLSEIRQVGKDKYHMISFICAIKKKNPK